jgi:hypothetical protein
MPAPAVAIELPLTPRILIVDDDVDLLRSLKDFFLGLGYEVDTCQIPEDAQRKIEERGTHYYQMVAFDVDFKGLSSFSGEDFVINNPHLFGKAYKVIISAGSWYTKDRQKDLRNANIEFVEKSHKLGIHLATVLKADMEQRVKTKAEELTAETGSHINFKITLPTGAGQAEGVVPIHAAAPASPRLQSPFSEVILDLKGALIEWLRTRREPDKKVFKCGAAIFSANEMIEQVEKETEVGLDHIRMMIGEFKCSIGMGA